jgi:hypothetical protein
LWFEVRTYAQREVIQTAVLQRLGTCFAVEPPTTENAMKHEALYLEIQRACDLLATHDGKIEDQHRAVVDELIDKCEIAAMNDEAELGMWERRELGLARAALASGWLRLALTAAHKAVQVSELPSDQYDYGWNYSQALVEKNSF